MYGFLVGFSLQTFSTVTTTISVRRELDMLLAFSCLKAS